MHGRWLRFRVVILLKVLLILHVKCSYFEIFIVVNHTIPYIMYKFSTIPLVT